MAIGVEHGDFECHRWTILCATVSQLNWIFTPDIFVYTLKFYRSERHLNVSGETVFLSYLCFVHRNNTSVRYRFWNGFGFFLHTHIWNMKWIQRRKGHSKCTNFSVKHKNILYIICAIIPYSIRFAANGWTRKDHCQWVQWTTICVYMFWIRFLDYVNYEM